MCVSGSRKVGSWNGDGETVFLVKAYWYVQVLIHLTCNMACGSGWEEKLVSVCVVIC